MFSRLWLAAAVALLAACAAQPAEELAIGSEAAELRFVDLTDDYERIWTETQALPEGERVAHFKQAFARIIPGFYDARRLESFGVTPEQYDVFIGRMLEVYSSRRDEINRVARELGTMIAPAIASFEAEFGPMRGYPPIYLVHAHNEFDGGTRELAEGTRLLFGADMIARLYRDKPVQPFFHHELFHLYHARTFPECDKIWCSLWTEGLATYVAARLNPGAGDEALLLTSPVPLRPAVEANREEAVCAVLARLGSEDRGAYAPLFAGGGEPLSPNLPRRFGYYVGLLVAEDLGRTRTLRELAALDHDHARPLIEQSLRRMADCGGQPGSA